MNARRPVALAALGLCLLAPALASGQEETAGADPEVDVGPFLEIGRPASGVIEWGEQRWESFRVTVPENAMVLTLRLDGSPVDLDLFARHGAPILDYEEDSEHDAISDLYNETLRITRASDPPLAPGVYYIDVVYNLESEPRVGKKRAKELPFTLTAEIIQSRVDGTLAPGKPIASKTSPESGWFRTFRIEVPASARVLRIDLDDVYGDLDLIARRNRPIFEREPTDLVAESVRGRETLLIDRSTDPPLAAGTWYVNVFDPFELDPVGFTVHARFEATPPPELLAIPTLRAPSDGLDRALLGTVEILTETSTGSGTLVSPDGWVLTNYHVVEDDAGNLLAPGELVIGLCLDPRRPTLEMFRGSVKLHDKDLDLALVRIESGFYGQPLPAGYRFPALDLGHPGNLRMGEPITIVGFPSVGGLGSRASVTLTRGVISGFDTTGHGVVLKTDAEIASGNSGGAALDASFHLVGVPTASVEDTEGYSHLGYILPIDLMPKEWWARIGK